MQNLAVIWHKFFVLGAVMAVFSASAAEVRSWPAPVVRTSRPMSVRVNGKPVEVVTIPAPDHCLKGENAQPYYAAFFDADGEVEVEVGGQSLRETRILPLSRGGCPQIVGDNRLKFRAKVPFTVAVEPHGRHHALIVVGNEIEKDAPKPGDAGVVYIAPGQHYRDEALRLKSNETLYLAPGAYLESAVAAKGTNITVRGHGILSGSCWAHERGPKGGGVMASFSGKNITVRDVTLMSSYNWTLVLGGCEDVLVDNVKILNGRVLNDDGIDVCSSRRVTIRNCFIRSQDDCITPKWWCEDLLVENCALWTDVANIFRIGYECAAKGTVYRNHTYRNIDILHQSIGKKPASEYWAENAIFIQPGNDQRFENFTFENLRFDTPEPGDLFLTMRTFKVNDQWQHHQEAGHFRNLTVRNVHVPGPLAPHTLGVWLESHDSDHRIEGVKFENVTGVGPLKTVGDVRGVDIPASAFAPQAKPVEAWTFSPADVWRQECGAILTKGGGSSSATADVPVVTGGVFTATVRAETPPKDNRATTFGLRVAGPEGSWALALYRQASKGPTPGSRAFDFTHHCGKRTWAPKGETCLYSRGRCAWKFGETYVFSIRLTDRGVEATVFDASGTEIFAEAWIFGKCPAVKAGRPQVFSWNGTGGVFSDVRVQPLAISVKQQNKE